MPRAKVIDWPSIACAVLMFVASAQAQPVLEQVIDQTKLIKQKQLAPASVAKQPQDDAPPPAPPALWSISGINEALVAEFWQGDAVYRVPLEKGARLPTGWQVIAFDSQSVTLKMGRERRKLTAAARGSTGWEFPNVPRSAAAAAAAANAPVSSNPAGSNARVAAGNLPPLAMPPSAGQPPSNSSPPAR